MVYMENKPVGTSENVWCCRREYTTQEVKTAVLIEGMIKKILKRGPKSEDRSR